MSGDLLTKHYTEVIVPEMMKEREYKNALQVPRLEKIVLNCGIGTKFDRSVMEEAREMLTNITGQQAVITKARKSISNFKLRDGQAIGCCVTLRKKMMFNFLYRLVNVALPRVRDFRGINATGFDGSGNYNMGMKDQSVFTEIDLDKMKNTIGMNVTFVTSAKTDDEAFALLQKFGMPFASKERA